MTVEKKIERELGNGLLLRYSRKQDAKALAEFNAVMHSDSGPNQPDDRIGAWTRDLLSGKHPTHSPGDFLLVENTADRRIVSAMNLISQTWAYEGVHFDVGRPELVGTLPDYRRRGLIRTQFEEIHRWSAERGEMVQAITGIPHFYRQFGYEMGLNLGGGRAGFELQVPKLARGRKEPFTFRRAVEKDVPFLVDTLERAAKRSLITCVYDERMWHYRLRGLRRQNVNRLDFRIIEDASTKKPIGYLAHPWFAWGTGLTALELELIKGASWLEVSQSVVRYLWKTGGKMLARKDKPCSAFAFWLGIEHPVYDALGEALPRIRPPYAWYIRVPDLLKFILHIRSVLEKRLAESVAIGYSGELKVNFYQKGLLFRFKDGKLKGVDDWKADKYEGGDAAFPDLTFLRVLFGHSSVAELRALFADCWCENYRTALLLDILFPKKPSNFSAVV